MERIAQSTIAEPAVFSGVGLHSGERTRIEIRPAEPGSGVVFHRRDFGAGDDPRALVTATPEAVCDTRLGTTVENASGARVATIEHLMAALSITGVDNAVVAVDGAEIPILDGSAAPFVAGIDRAGVLRQSLARRAIGVTEPIEVADGDRFIRISPSTARALDVSISFEAAAIGEQAVALDLDDRDRLRDEVAAARTFCRLEDIETMRARGLAQGGGLDNAIVVDGRRILNADPLRHPREFVLHKALDLIGDLALAGVNARGRILARKPGHDLNVRFAQRLSSLARRAD